MAESLPIVIVPGLGSSARTHLDILPGLWRHGPVAVANHTRDDTIAGLAKRVLDEAPSGPFVLIGHSLGGYIVLEMMRQAPQRVAKLLLMNTQARTDPPEVTQTLRKPARLIHSVAPSMCSVFIRVAQSDCGPSRNVSSTNPTIA